MNDKTINVNTQNKKKKHSKTQKLIAKHIKMRCMVIQRSVLQGGGTATT